MFSVGKVKLLLLPVVPDVLHVVVVLHEVDHLGHVLDVVLIGELDVVLGDHLDGGAGKDIALALQGGGDGVEVIRGGGDLEHIAVGGEVLRAAVQGVHHDGLLVQVALLVVDDDDALLVEAPADAAGGAQVPTVLVEEVADLGGGAVAVVGEGLHDDGHAAGTIALVDHLLEVLSAAGPQGLVDGALDVVIGHIGGLGLGDNGGQAGVVGGIAAAAALLHRHNDLLGDFGEGRGALGVRRTLGLLNIMPFGMS